MESSLKNPRNYPLCLLEFQDTRRAKFFTCSRTNRSSYASISVFSSSPQEESQFLIPAQACKGNCRYHDFLFSALKHYNNPLFQLRLADALIELHVRMPETRSTQNCPRTTHLVISSHLPILSPKSPDPQSYTPSPILHEYSKHNTQTCNGDHAP